VQVNVIGNTVAIASSIGLAIGILIENKKLQKVMFWFIVVILAFVILALALHNSKERKADRI
jgi:uncharacterized membrane protein YfcA